MSKGTYPYPEDEFDAAEDVDGPRGVHRAPRSRWSTLLPFVVVLLVFSGLAFGVVQYMSSTGTTLPSGLNGSETTDDSQAEDSTDAETPAEGETPAEPATEEPPATPNLAAPVVVLNAARVAGLAGSTAKVLTDNGYTAVTTGNHDGVGVTSTTVFYATEDQKVTADNVAQLLAITQVVLSPTEATAGISVVLQTDFAP